MHRLYHVHKSFHLCLFFVFFQTHTNDIYIQHLHNLSHDFIIIHCYMLCMCTVFFRFNTTAAVRCSLVFVFVCFCAPFAPILLHLFHIQSHIHFISSTSFSFSSSFHFSIFFLKCNSLQFVLLPLLIIYYCVYVVLVGKAVELKMKWEKMKTAIYAINTQL